jgi:hypothetical protein
MISIGYTIYFSHNSSKISHLIYNDRGEQKWVKIWNSKYSDLTKESSFELLIVHPQILASPAANPHGLLSRDTILLYRGMTAINSTQRSHV